MKKTTLLTILFLLIAVNAYSANWYACSTGDNSDPTDGTCANALNEAGFNNSDNWDGTNFDITPGDTIYLMDDGGAFTATLTIQESGTSGNVITITPNSSDSVVITSGATGIYSNDMDYITIDGSSSGTNLTINVPSTNNINGVRGKDAEYLILTNLIITGPGDEGGGDSGDTVNGIQINGDNYTVTNNTITLTSRGILVNRTATGVTTTGLISGNTIYDMEAGTDDEGDCITISADAANDADQSGLIIEKNICYNFYDDGIDLFASFGATVRYNEIGPTSPATQAGCSGIKTGGTNSWSGHSFAYGNYIHDLHCVARTTPARDNRGINTNGSGPASIYANLIHDINATDGKGKCIYYHPDNMDGVESGYVHNNTCQNAQKNGIDVTNLAAGGGTVVIANNIFESDDWDIQTNSSTNYLQITGGNNILQNDAAARAGGANCVDTQCYDGVNDLGTTDPLLVNVGADDYRPTAQSPGIDAGQYESTYDYCLSTASDTSDWVNTVQVVTNTGQHGLTHIGAYCPDWWGGE